MNRKAFLAATDPLLARRRDEPLIIGGYEVSKASADETYRALCWIEDALIERLMLRTRRHARELRRMRDRFIVLAIGALVTVVAMALALLSV